MVQKKSETKNTEAIQHVLVPKHEIISDKERIELMEKYNVSISELPKIRANDPGIRHLKVKHGDIIKISRNSISAGESVFFRAVTTE